MLTRRFFLKSSALAMAGVGSAPAWLARTVHAADAPGPRRKILVAIFQRGAVDGLNVVVPFGEARYYDLRPTLAIPKPDGRGGGAIDLDGFFGLHPSLSPLAPIYQAGHLAIVQAVGSPDPTRSHFDAQDYMESGTPGLKGTNDGWLNRALPSEQPPASVVRAVSIGAALPRALRGPHEAVAINNLNDFQVRSPLGGVAFESMYDATLDPMLHGAGRDTFEAVKVMQAVQKQTYVPSGNAKYPNGRLGQSLLQIARLIKSDVGLEVAFADVGGWDTHVNEVGAKSTQGQLANLLGEFGLALAAFYRDLGDRMADVSVVTMSEFGRTARENGSRGTDHGHANVMFVLGGDIRGGRVYGDWPGMTDEQLYEQRDLAVTTDFRDVLGELVTLRLGRTLQTVFPGYDQPHFRGIVGA